MVTNHLAQRPVIRRVGTCHNTPCNGRQKLSQACNTIRVETTSQQQARYNLESRSAAAFLKGANIRSHRAILVFKLDQQGHLARDQSQNLIQSLEYLHSRQIIELRPVGRPSFAQLSQFQPSNGLTHNHETP